ncbi:hypothetical protein Fmac_012979 [Flemingia macrophylla]|uniref:Uncharacterized protein n=1 Tax=Flemingia macrophylla TaxID=520843 RepID=A0ABD1MRU1_9FABA
MEVSPSRFYFLSVRAPFLRSSAAVAQDYLYPNHENFVCCLIIEFFIIKKPLQIQIWFWIFQTLSTCVQIPNDCRSWPTVMTMALKSLNKLPFVLGTIPSERKR